jgi:arabinogalactan oligomer/maltooligosaccharide transport system substrate-binding protein
MHKHLKVLVGLVMVFGLIAAACGGTAETTTTAAATTTAAPTTTMATTTTAATTTAAVTPLLVWADETRVPIIEAVAADFEAATGVPVEVQLVGFGDIRTNMVQQAPLGEGADVFIGAHDWLGELVANGVVEPLELGERAADFFNVALDAFTYDGKRYGVPYAIEAIGLYRNTALVPDAPATFEDLLATCDALGDAVTQCLALPAGDAYHHYPFIASTGGYIFAYDGVSYDPTDVGLDNAGAIEGFTFLDQLVKDGYLDPAVDYNTMTNLFYNNQAAFMWTGPWALPDTKAAVEAGTLSGYATSVLPEILGNTAVPFVGVQGFMVNAFSQQKALAETFVLDYIATKDVMTELYNVGLRAPAFIESFNEVATDPDVQAFGESAAAGQPMPNIPEMASVWDFLATAVSAIYNQTATPEEALTTAADGVRAAIAGG